MSETFSDLSVHHINLEEENKYLKITIAVLREKIEELERHRSEIIQQHKANSHNEMIQIQSTVNTLRSQLEESHIIHENKIQLSVARANDQNRQLQDMVHYLRQKLEKYENLELMANEFANSYLSNDPFPHIVFDNFFKKKGQSRD